ncbi:MAG: metal-dependent transcriptional regulator [Clostridia bacterium]|nr:metal-dependent transcriptional regulator [Clostridia bacterium]
MAIQESGENYLEAILIIKERKGYVRSIDIANELKVSKPSVSRAMSVLKKEGLIDVDGLNQILLTDEGRKIAETIYERHKVITKFLVSLGVDEETAASDACRIEHVISPVSFEKIKEKFVNS